MNGGGKTGEPHAKEQNRTLYLSCAQKSIQNGLNVKA